MSDKNGPHTIGQKPAAYTERQAVRADYKDDVKHSPLPWRISEVDGDGEVIARGMKDANGKGVNKGHDIEMFTEADAELIVRAVNMHDELVAVCKALLDLNVPLDTSHRLAVAALARAGQAVPS